MRENMDREQPKNQQAQPERKGGGNRRNASGQHGGSKVGLERRSYGGGQNAQRGGRPKYAPRPDDNSRIVALNALSEVSQQGAYCQLALDKCLRASRISPEDKRLATRIFYSAVENKIRLNHVLRQFIDKYPDPYTADVLHIAAAQLLFMDRMPDHAVVDQAVRHMKMAHRERYGGLVNGVLRSLIRARDAGEIEYPDREKEPVRYLSVMYSLPEALLARLVAAFGMEETERIIAWKPEERREVVRPNYTLMDAGAFENYARRMEWDFEPAPVPGALLVKGAGDLAGLPDYRKGLFSIQSVGSMLAAMAVRPKRGMHVLDACAAPGGKTAFIAEQLDGTGRVYAWDVHDHRVNLIRAQAERLRLYNIRPAVRDARRHYEDMEWALDAVLVDAPCSGLGEMADKPDIKYHITGESIDALVQTQAEILDAVCDYVKPGGALVYSTCTIMPEENIAQVKAFLQRHPEFELDADVRWLPEAFRERVSEGCLQLMGYRDQTEGFFIARMKKKQGRRPL